MQTRIHFMVIIIDGIYVTVSSTMYNILAFPDFRCLSVPGCIWCKTRISEDDPLAVGCVRKVEDGTGTECPEEDTMEADFEVNIEVNKTLSKVS